MRKRIVNIIIVIEFCLAMLLPIFGLNFKKGKISVSENRQLTAFPELKSEDGEYRHDLSPELIAWFEDNLGLRDKYINISAFLKYKLLKKSNSYKVEMGKEGWLFLRDDNNYEIIDGNYPMFDEFYLERYCNNQQLTSDHFKSHGIEYVFAIAPSKVSIYPEYIASGDYGVTYTVANALEDYLEEHSDVKVIKLKEALLEEKDKSENILYLKTDTHWSAYGRYVGYKKITEDLNNWGIIDCDNLKVEFFENEEHIGDLSKMMGPIYLSGEYLKEPCVDWKIVDEGLHEAGEEDELYRKIEQMAKEAELKPGYYSVWKNENGNGKKALVYGDSMFGTCLIPHLAENFSELTFLWTYNINQEVVDLVKPDVVIAEFSERSMGTHMDGLNESFLRKNIIYNQEENTLDITYIDSGAYEKMYFPVFEEDEGKENAIWYEAERIDNVTWHYVVDLSKHAKGQEYEVYFFDGPTIECNCVTSESINIGD